MSKKGLPASIAMRHGKHYVEELSKPTRSIGKLIAIDLILPNPEQPRIDVGDLAELSDSIRERGVLEPLLVKRVSDKDIYLIIAGERRWRSAKIAGLTEVPCIELDIDERAIAEIALIENMQRKDLTVWEEADGLLALQTKFGYTHADIAKKIGKSRTSVTESLNIASLSVNVRNKLKQFGNDSKQFLLTVARQFDEEAMLKYLDSQITNGNSKDILSKDILSKDSTKEVKTLRKEDSKDVIGESNFNHPSKLFNFTNTEAGYTLRVKFKHIADKEKVIETLRNLIIHLESY